jgi:hypothetical protein
MLYFVTITFVFKVKHVFKGYPSGVRYVEFKHGGQDTKNWAGHFGAKMTNSGVFVGKKRSNKKKRVRLNYFEKMCFFSNWIILKGICTYIFAFFVLEYF